MKTTLNLDDRLLANARKAALQRGVTLTSVVEDALRTSLTLTTNRPYRFEWKTESGELLPGVDINNRNKLYDLMDGIA